MRLPQRLEQSGRLFTHLLQKEVTKEMVKEWRQQNQ